MDGMGRPAEGNKKRRETPVHQNVGEMETPHPAVGKTKCTCCTGTSHLVLRYAWMHGSSVAIAVYIHAAPLAVAGTSRAQSPA